MSQKLQLRRGFAAEGLQTLLAAGEPGFDLDEHRLRVGDGTTLGGHLFSPTSQLSGFTSHNPAAAGNTLLAPGRPFLQWSALVTLDPGTAPYTHTLTLGTDRAQAGSLLFVLISLPDSDQPTLELRNNQATGNLLQTLTGNANEATWFLAQLVFDGTQWIKLTGHYVP